MKKFLISAVLVAALLTAAQAYANPVVTIPSQMQQGGGTVTGSGSTYQEAYQDARNRIPAGKGPKSVQTWKSGETWYCTITY